MSAETTDFVAALRNLVDELDVLHEYLGTLPAPELHLFVALKNALTTYDAAKKKDGHNNLHST